MLYTPASDASFIHRSAPENIEGMLAWVRETLGLDDDRPWRLISARRKFGKTLFEIEEESPAGPVRLIGKFGKRERTETLCYALAALRNAGFAPPARCTVPELIACVP